MAKYDLLRRFLRRRRNAEVEMAFNEIEQIIGALASIAFSAIAGFPLNLAVTAVHHRLIKYPVT